MTYSNEVYIGAIAALAKLRPSLAEKEQYTVDFISECIAEKAERDINANVDKPPLTNADRIRSMTNEELAEMILDW